MPQQPEVKIVDVDRPELCETFADSILKIGFDGQVWRFEFGVTRMDEPKPPILPGKRYPACRLVLPPKTGLEFAAQLKGLIDVMEKQGVIKTMPAASMITPPAGSKPN
jgi:hypothetical protein